MKYEHQPLEEKWHKKWEEAGVFHASNQSDKEKYYALIEFPYPSGQGLHVGHPRSYTAIDIIARSAACRGIMCCIRLAGMHSVCLLKTLQLKIMYIPKL